MTATATNGTSDRLYPWVFADAFDGMTVVRGLPKIVLQRIHAPQRWQGGAVHGWLFNGDELPDLEAKLGTEGIEMQPADSPMKPWTYTAPPMTVDEAEEATLHLIGCYGIIETKAIQFTHIANEILKRRGWAALGYTSFDAYCQDRLKFTLPREVRKEIVLAAISAHMSNRAAAALTGVDEGTVRSQLRNNSAVDRPATRIGRDGRERRLPVTPGPPEAEPPEYQGSVVNGPWGDPEPVPESVGIDFSCAVQTIALMEDHLLPQDMLHRLMSRCQSQIVRWEGQ